MNRFSKEKNRLVYCYDYEKVWIEPWGSNSLRVRATHQKMMPEREWALLCPGSNVEPEIEIQTDAARITNGKITAEITDYGKITFFNENHDIILEEYVRDNKNVHLDICSSLGIAAREFKGILGGDYEITARFESDPAEYLYGMGQYQQSALNLKGCFLELAQRNSQASVPFLLSSKGYGFLWNNPAIGSVMFGHNITTWNIKSADIMDYWITAGDSPAEIEESYADITGKAPMMPDYAMGFWQCKLRYQTQDELLEVAREYKRRNLPISVIVVDYFHWHKQGEWKFDPVYWPDPDGMVGELNKMGIELMVSIWPTVDNESENYHEMLEKGYLVNTDRGLRLAMSFHGNVIHYDATNEDARKYVWSKVKQNYASKGIKMFWLDEAEPEYTVHDFDIYRYHLGSNLRVGNCYPMLYAKGFYDGMKEEGQENIINLVRCAWAGSQRYGALVWSGDIYSSFSSLRNQIPAGLNMGIAGIPWWTTDIGGFHGGDIQDEKFRELFIRWFEYGTFCPVMRLHGDRIPKQSQIGTTGGAECLSGADNEVWSYGENVLAICTKYMNIRERMKSYIRDLMEQAHEKGTPVIRTLFYAYPNDKQAWEIADQYMFGEDLLVSPVYESGCAKKNVYLPIGERWKSVWDGTSYEGGNWVSATCSIETIPVFVREGAEKIDYKYIFGE